MNKPLNFSCISTVNSRLERVDATTPPFPGRLRQQRLQQLDIYNRQVLSELIGKQILIFFLALT